VEDIVEIVDIDVGAVVDIAAVAVAVAAETGVRYIRYRRVVAVAAAVELRVVLMVPCATLWIADGLPSSDICDPVPFGVVRSSAGTLPFPP